MLKCWKLCDAYPIETENIAIHILQSRPYVKELPHVATVIAAKLTHHGSLNRIAKKYPNVYQLEKEILLSMPEIKPVIPCRELQRYIWWHQLTAPPLTILAALVVLQDDHLYRLIKFNKVYKILKEVSKLYKINIKILIKEYNVTKSVIILLSS